jgi:hypothetical protein
MHHFLDPKHADYIYFLIEFGTNNYGHYNEIAVRVAKYGTMTTIINYKTKKFVKFPLKFVS